MLPDFLVYVYDPLKEPLFSLIEFKEQPTTHAVSQLEKGLEVLKNHPKSFAVIPSPKRVDCVIAMNKKKGCAHAAQLAIILGWKGTYFGSACKIRLVDFPGSLYS